MTMLRDPGHVPHSVPDSQSDLVSRARSRASFRRTASAKVAMIGAGQLARMTHQAAVDLGVLPESPDGASDRKRSAGARRYRSERSTVGEGTVSADNALVGNLRAEVLAALSGRERDLAAAGRPPLRAVDEQALGRQQGNFITRVSG